MLGNSILLSDWCTWEFLKLDAITQIILKEYQILSHIEQKWLQVITSGNTKIVGLYYQIFRLLAWENITLYEVVSTTNEFIIVVEDHLVEKAFSVISQLKTIDFYKQ